MSQVVVLLVGGVVGVVVLRAAGVVLLAGPARRGPCTVSAARWEQSMTALRGAFRALVFVTAGGTGLMVTTGVVEAAPGTDRAALEELSASAPVAAYALLGLSALGLAVVIVAAAGVVSAPLMRLTVARDTVGTAHERRVRGCMTDSGEGVR